MSEQTRINELKYHERLNISILSINKVKTLIKNDILDTIAAWDMGRNVDKQCYHIIGPAGVGKTQICHQIANELTQEIFSGHNKNNPDKQKKFECLMIKAPVLARDDFIIPFPVEEDGGSSYTFKMLYSDFVPKVTDSYGLFVIDEFSRGDHQLQQLLWQIQNEYAVHRHEFPKGWFVISIDNPDDSEYSMDTLEDAAGLRRQLHIYVEVIAPDFLEYAIANKFHPLVIEWIQARPERLYDAQAQKMGSVYANPASYEKLSDHLWKMELRRGKIDFVELDHKASGLLNTNMTQLFIEFARDKKDIHPKDIFYKFKEVKPKVAELLKENNLSKLGELMTGYCTFMSTSRPPYTEQNVKNVFDFLMMMPIESAALFVSQLDTFDRASEPFIYMTKLHLALFKYSPDYRSKFYDPIIKAANIQL
jgi:hypothetical protein